MTLTRWQRPEPSSLTPFRRVASLRDELDSLFSLAFGRLTGADGEDGREAQMLEGWYPAVDLYEDKDNLIVKAEIPGLKKEDIEISLHDGYLTLSGERRQEKKEETGDVYRAERWEGRFQRTISLPYQVDKDKIKATYNDGVLTVVLPKSEEAKPKQIQISAK